MGPALPLLWPFRLWLNLSTFPPNLCRQASLSGLQPPQEEARARREGQGLPPERATLLQIYDV